MTTQHETLQINNKQITKKRKEVESVKTGWPEVVKIGTHFNEKIY